MARPKKTETKAKYTPESVLNETKKTEVIKVIKPFIYHGKVFKKEIKESELDKADKIKLFELGVIKC